MSYLVPRNDVYDFIMNPVGWQPSWTPSYFEIINCGEDDKWTPGLIAMALTLPMSLPMSLPLSLPLSDMDPPQLRKLRVGDKWEIRVFIVYRVRGT